jgi:hypothetical protein
MRMGVGTGMDGKKNRIYNRYENRNENRNRAGVGIGIGIGIGIGVREYLESC